MNSKVLRQPDKINQDPLTYDQSVSTSVLSETVPRLKTRKTRKHFFLKKKSKNEIKKEKKRKMKKKEKQKEKKKKKKNREKKRELKKIKTREQKRKKK